MGDTPSALGKNFVDVYLNRKSVRHFGEQELSFEQVQELLDIASWAPSAGNFQPWRVLALNAEQTQALRDLHEFEGYQSAFSSALISVQEHSGKKGRESVETLMRLYETDLKARGRPLALVIYSESWGLATYFKHAKAALQVMVFRALNASSWLDRFRIVGSTVSRAWGDFKLSSKVEDDSVLCFTMGILLAAEARGLAGCFQSCYLKQIQKFLQKVAAPGHPIRSRRNRVHAVLLLGTSKNSQGGLGEINTRSRRKVLLERI
jgi:nitroreductase